MINFSNIIRKDGLDLREYLSLPALSHSQLKREVNGIVPDFKITPNVTIGKLVDSILTDPATADMTDPLYKCSKVFAAKISATFGDLIKRFDKQVSYFADMEFQGFKINAKVRPDFILTGYAAIDLKFTKSKKIDALIDFMGYKNQMWMQAKCAQVPNAYLMVYSEPLNDVIIKKVDVSSNYNEFWAEKIIKFGNYEPATNLPG